MPNIKIYGLSEKEAKELRERICNVMQSKGYDDATAMTTIVKSDCQTVGEKREEAPYLEIVSTHKSDFEPIVAGLKELKIGLDIEKHLLEDDGFIPASEME